MDKKAQVHPIFDQESLILTREAQKKSQQSQGPLITPPNRLCLHQQIIIHSKYLSISKPAKL
jgi:hypothetical protein